MLNADDLSWLTTNVRAYDERRVKTLTAYTVTSSIFLAAPSARISFADFLARDALGARLDFVYVLVVERKNKSASVLYLPSALLRHRDS